MKMRSQLNTKHACFKDTTNCVCWLRLFYYMTWTKLVCISHYTKSLAKRARVCLLFIFVFFVIRVFAFASKSKHKSKHTVTITITNRHEVVLHSTMCSVEYGKIKLKAQRRQLFLSVSHWAYSASNVNTRKAREPDAGASSQSHIRTDRIVHTQIQNIAHKTPPDTHSLRVFGLVDVHFFFVSVSVGPVGVSEYKCLLFLQLMFYHRTITNMFSAH